MEKTFLKSLIILSFSLLFHSNVFAQEEFSSTQIKKYKKGIFEVVTLKLEDTTIYKEEFPHDLIPFHIRNDKYHSVGTAFLVGSKTFVSAAHVFSIGQRSLLSKKFALRDSDGNIFEIENVEKFSNYRDFIQFTVKQDTADYHSFSFAKLFEAGDTIYAAGNALGEGVIFRKGTLTSFTFEPVNGLWKDIRFSAAASPGNSGGPLLNLNGEVVGIVTKKSNNENLNYAFPINDFEAFSGKEAEFFNNQMGEYESGKNITYAWDFKTSLPKSILKLRAEAEADFLKRLQTGRDEFVQKYNADIFPNHPKVPAYLKHQGSNSSLAIIDANGNGKWSLYKAQDQSRIKITNNQSLWYSTNDNILGDYQFFLEKPESMSLSEFVASPKTVLDTFLVSVQWNRTVADMPVYIESYGEPTTTEQHTDNYGRVWMKAVWFDNYADQGIMIYCLPNPRGVVCDLIITDASWLHVQKEAYKDNLHRMMLSYSAEIGEWLAFLALPEDIQSPLFKKAKLALNDDSLSLKFGEYSGTFENIELNTDSSLYMSVKIDPDDINKLTVTYFNFTPNINEDTSYSVSKFYDQKEDGSDSYTDFWSKFTKQISPYDASVVNEGEVLSKKINLGENGKAPSGEVKSDSGVGYMATCKIESKRGEATLNSSCDAFIKGLTNASL